MSYIYTQSQALERIAVLMENIQSHHEEARELAERFEIPFHIELEGGREYNTTHSYLPWSSSDTTWASSSVNC